MPYSKPILVVEDEADAVFLMERACEKAGVRNPLRVVSNGSEAIEYLGHATDGKDPNFPLPVIVMLDINLPRKSGVDVLKWIRGNPTTKYLVVVVFTSSNSQRDINDSYEAGANSYLVKPTSFAALSELVALFRVYWLERNQPHIKTS